MGRGPSARAHRQALDAAAELFAERGIDATSMDAIAAAAGVSKATLYKHWADKEALCLEVLRHVHRPEEVPSAPDSGDLRADLTAFLAYEPAAATAEIRKRLLPHLMAYSAKNHEFARAWRAQVMERMRARLAALLKRGIDTGVFDSSLDEELSVALLWGPMLYGHMVGPEVSRVTLAREVVHSFWSAHARAGGPPLRGRGRRPRRPLRRTPADLRR